MDAPAVARRYIDAWNAHDGATVLGTFAEGGTYADPATGEPLSGSRIAEYADGLFALLPDVCFDVTATHGVDDTTVVVPWRMRGTAAAPPGGDHGGRHGRSRTVDLPGLDVIAVDGDRVRSVVGYFDQKTMLEQLGLRLVMVPADPSGPFTFGAMVRGSAGSTAVPGAFSVTALLTRSPEARAEVDRRTYQVYEDLSAIPGFLSFLGLEVGDYRMTVTAWESVEAVGRMMRSPAHAEAVRWLYDNDVADAGMLSVLRPERMTLLRRCGGCCALVQAAGDEPTCPNCGRSLTQRGSYV